MKVVLDTNIFVSGIHWSGSSEKILRAWMEAKAGYIVSQDKHLLVVKEYRGIKIIPPEEFLKLL